MNSDNHGRRFHLKTGVFHRVAADEKLLDSSLSLGIDTYGNPIKGTISP